MPHKDNIYVGLDIGTTKICTVVARQNMEGGIDIIGLGSAPSTGIRKGVVVNIDSTVKAIKDSIAMAERMSGVTVKSVCAGIAGGHIESFNSRGVVAVKSGEVTQNDIDRVIEVASAVNIPMGYEVLHILPQQYILDGQDEIKDPIGMSGVRLEVEVHIVTGAVSSATNITKSCSKAGIAVEDIYLEQLASSEAVLTEEEREIGVCLIDGGGGTTDMAVFNRGACYHTAVLQIGGNNFTRDLTSGLSTSESEAEKIKYAYKPKLLAYDVYGSTEVFFALLAMNGMHNIKQFDLSELYFFALTPIDLSTFLNDIYNAESSYLTLNRSSLGIYES